MAKPRKHECFGQPYEVVQLLRVHSSGHYYYPVVVLMLDLILHCGIEWRLSMWSYRTV